MIERLLAEPRAVLTLLTGRRAAAAERADRTLRCAPGVEIEVHEGGQPHYPLLIGAE